MARRYWLMKTEPETFSFDDLLKAPRKTTHWEGVRNYQARNFMRDEMKKGDGVLLYHSNCDDPAVMGTAVVDREAYPDPDAFNPKSDYFDEDAKKKGVNPWVMVDVKADEKFKTPVNRDALRADKRCRGMMVLAKGSRLSIQPVTEAEFEAVKALGGL